MRGKIDNLRAQPDFLQQNRRSRKRKTGVWSADLGFSPHFRNRRTEVCGKFWNPRAHRPFRAKKPQVEALLLSGMVGMSRICRILPIWAASTGLSRLLCATSWLFLDLKRYRHVLKEIVAPAIVEHPLSVHQVHHDSWAGASFVGDTLYICRRLAVSIG